MTDAALFSSHLPTDRTDALRARTAAAFGALRADLEALVRIPSVSSADPDPARRRPRVPMPSSPQLLGAGLEDVRVADRIDG